MLTLRDSLVSSSARALAIRRRPDLQARRHQYMGRSYWIVKEPLGLRYFRFQDEEFAILAMLDGHTSLDEIKQRFEHDFPPQKITLEELQRLLGMLYQSGLIVADAPGQGPELLQRRRKQRRQQWLTSWMNILSIRFKGFDPERVLSWLHPRVRWFFSWPAVVVCLLVALSAAALVTVQFETFRARLPGFHDFFNLRNAFWLAMTLGATKVLHEFGHGLMCKHFGGECHEMGVMLLVLTPCLYCNVSDSWMLPSKWQRAAIGAAGMYVEVVLASVSTFLWWITEPGLLHYTCLNVMFVSSVTTILFNINPLLRYDGYYILSDLTEIPNLRQKASQLLSRKLGEWLLGIEPAEDPFLPERRQVFFASYAVASAVYRWVVTASILWFLYQFFKPYRLEILGEAIALASLASLVGMPLWKTARFFYIPGRMEQVNKQRMYVSLGGLVLLLLAALWVPLPHSILCTLEVQPRDAQPVYVNVGDGGRLDELFVQIGQRVEQGQELARLVNVDIELETKQIEATRDQYRRKLANLWQQRYRDSKVGGDIPSMQEALDAIERQLKQKRADTARLVLRAPVAGVVLPPPEHPEREPPEGQLPTWSRTPFDPENAHAHLDEGTLFCLIGDLHKYEAVLVVDQADVELVRKEGQTPTADIAIDELAGRSLRSHVVEVADSELKISSRRLSAKNGGELVTMTDPTTGHEKPRSTSYQARVPLDDPDGLLRCGLRGTARVYTSWQPLAFRLWRWASHTFSFKL